VLTLLLLPTLYGIVDRWLGSGLRERRAARGEPLEPEDDDVSVADA
jgi:hypothetical protein